MCTRHISPKSHIYRMLKVRLVSYWHFTILAPKSLARSSPIKLYLTIFIQVRINNNFNPAIAFTRDLVEDFIVQDTLRYSQRISKLN